MFSGSRLSHHLRDCNHHTHHHHQLGLGFGFGFGLGFHHSPTTSKLFSTSFPRSSSSSSLSSIPDKRFSSSTTSSSSSSSPSSSIDFGLPIVGCLRPSSSGTGIPTLSNCFSQHEDDHEPPREALSSMAGGIVALGKFDALHIGHRQLVVQAAKVGVPFLLSFVGMAEVLGWEPRAPIVAKCDRKRVLSSWAPYCSNVTPTEFEIDFSKVRHLSPQQFVEKLSREFGVRGVVAGENYRFGYKAAGDASELVRLCQEYGMGAHIINSVMDKNQDSRDIRFRDSKEQGQVSSTRVRHALAKGDMKYVSELLGRQHRLVLMLEDQKGVSISKHGVSAPKSCLSNLPPKDGLYENCSLYIGEKNAVAVPCRVIIDTADIHLELGGIASSFIHNSSRGFRFLAIEFGDSGSGNI